MENVNRESMGDVYRGRLAVCQLEECVEVVLDGTGRNRAGGTGWYEQGNRVLQSNRASRRAEASDLKA
jgi:hypothetical protein